MRFKTSNIAEISWESSIDELVKNKKPSPTVEKLKAGGVLTLFDLLWILPLRINRTPQLRPFREARLDQYFKGSGQVIHIETKPAFGRKGKGKVLLFNASAVIKDGLSQENLNLRWYNLYPNQKKQIESLRYFTFLGIIQEFKSQKQIVNPQIVNDDIALSDYLIEYPTINKVSGNHIKKFIDLIPNKLWESIPQLLPELGYDTNLTLGDAFKIIHGRINLEHFNQQKKEDAELRLIYEEFLIDQIKILTRRKFIKRKDAPILSLPDSKINDLVNHLPFELTQDQHKVLTEIIKDIKSGHPMMRMIQGDVGCGKTIVAFLASRIANKCGFQVALMCPTEALAVQHFDTFKQLNPALELDLLLGSTKPKEKKLILSNLKNGTTEIIIGTHSLFQDSVEFKNLGLAIIDEQHKFGVEQRLRLIAKGQGTHSLIMTATPIPRTLSLAQYGDLDISSIKMMPAGRKGIKTRITERVNYDKYIEFIRARLKLGEQAFFVFPAIEESESLDIQNVNDSVKKYKSIFPDFIVEVLHGQMKSEDKERIVRDFREKRINILISTSVIEVGINVPNATIMSIYNPERFGLSSLHQLRGRVGRGDKGGFCFLVLNKDVSTEVFQRLTVIERNLDGFVIAEEDLRFRGEGDLFGVDQSGMVTSKKLANFLTHTTILEKVISDLDTIQKTRPEILESHFERLAKDQKILDTI